MKRVGNLWSTLIGFPNLLRSANQSARGKRFKPAVLAFHARLEDELWRLHEELRDKTWRPGPFKHFWIHDPKKRLISAAPYRDRVVHHALVNVLEPIWERSFLSDSYASRVDDFVAFADDKHSLLGAREAVGEFLAGLRVRLHPTKNAIFPVKQGIRFLGYRVWPTHVKLVPENVYRFRRRLRKLADRYFLHEIDWTEVVCRVMSWTGHASQADTWLLRQRLFDELLYRRASVE